MKNILLIRIPPPVSEVNFDTAVHWGRFSGAGERVGAVHISNIEQLKNDWLAHHTVADDEEELLPDQVLLLIPCAIALYKQVKMDSGQRKHISTALPYLIEEDLAQDIETVHLASFVHKKDDQVSLCVIPHSEMQSLLALFDQAGLSLDRVLAEAQFIEPEPGFTTLLLDTQAALVSSPGRAGVSLDYEVLKFALGAQKEPSQDNSILGELAGQNDQTHLSQIKLRYSDGDFAPPSERVESLKDWLAEQGWLIDEEVMATSAFDYMAGQYFKRRRSASLIDLRQGAYQCPRRAGRQMRRWKPVVAVLACWLVLELGISSGQGYYFHKQTHELWNTTMTDYLKLFPNDQQAKSAQNKQQMTFSVQRVLENRLRSGNQKHTGEPFLPLLQKVSAVSAGLGEDSKLDHQSMDFNDGNGQLILEFQTGSLETVDRFLAALKDSGLTTKLDSANQGKNSVLARMTISR